jgi:diguanylate cyclase (GGDEF)-like protein
VEVPSNGVSGPGRLTPSASQANGGHAATGQDPARYPMRDEHAIETDADSGQVVYDWDLSSDVIRWASNLSAVVGIRDCALLATGIGYAEHLAAESPSSRYEAIVGSTGCDTGGGVPFRAIYGLLPAKRSTAAPVWIEDTGRWFADATDRPGRAHGIIRVITKQFEAARIQAASVQRDPVTGAYSRAHFIEHVARQLSLAARKTSSFAVIVIGLDSEDGAIGDASIAEAAARLRADMRGHEILARHAGTRFAALLENCNAAQAEAAAARLIATIKGASFDATALQARVGIVMAPCHGRTPQALLQFADEALEAARQPGAAPVSRFEPELVRASARQSTQASDEILAALNDGRVVLALQPIVHSKTRVVAFHEALVRIRRVDGTLMLPDSLVPTAEKNGLVALIDRRVIDLAFGQLTADRRLVLSINASVTSLNDAYWFDHLRASCKLRPDAARRLTIEITETCVIADIEATRTILAAIKPLGVKIAIDDFGSGHSSFRNLRQLPIDYLKIDGAFAQNLAQSPDDRFFIRTLIDLARNLNIPTVAEWVEDEATAQILVDWGVEYLQGHLFGKAEFVADIASAARGRK